MKNQNSILVYKGTRIHESSKLLADQFGIKDNFSIKVIRKPLWLKHAFNFIQAPFISFRLKNYNIFLFEGLGAATVFPYIKKINRDSVIIVKGNSQEIFYIEKSKKWKIAFKLLNLSKNLDYMIAVSNMIKEDFEKYFDFEIIVCEGFMFRDYRMLSNLNINYDRKNFIFIGSNSYFKGVDLMIDIFILIKSMNFIDKETKFYLIGDHESFLKKLGYDLNLLNKKGIILIGRTDNIEDYLKNSLYHFHLARYEPNSVAIMEGMASGHIPLVSIKTGNRDFISKIDNNLIIKSFDKKEVILSIKRVLSYSKSRTLELSNKFKRESIIYSKENGLKRWTETWFNLMNRQIDFG